MNRFLATAFLLFCFGVLACKAQPPATGTIKAGNLRVYYERQGKGEAIVFLHAGLQDHTMWNDQVAALSGRYDVVTLDLPFHGNTAGTDTSLLAQDVLKIVLGSLGITRAAVAGLSMGASVAQDFVIAYPGRISKAVFISSGVNGYDKKYGIDSLSMDWYYKYDAAMKRGDTAGAAKEFTKAWAEGIYRSGDSLRTPVSRYVYATTLATLKRKAAGWPKLQETPPAVEKLATIKAPVLVIHGDKDLPYIVTTSNYLEKTIPGARHVVVKDAAHMLNMEKPAAFNRLLMDFLQTK